MHPDSHDSSSTAEAGVKTAFFGFSCVAQWSKVVIVTGKNRLNAIGGMIKTGWNMTKHLALD